MDLQREKVLNLSSEGSSWNSIGSIIFDLCWHSTSWQEYSTEQIVYILSQEEEKKG